MSDHTKRSVNSPEKTKIRKWVCGFLLIALLGGFYGCGAYLYSMLHTAEKTITTTYKKVKIKKARNVSKVLKEKKNRFRFCCSEPILATLAEAIRGEPIR